MTSIHERGGEWSFQASGCFEDDESLATQVSKALQQFVERWLIRTGCPSGRTIGAIDVPRFQRDVDSHGTGVRIGDVLCHE
jgi:hypothetical protein